MSLNKLKYNQKINILIMKKLQKLSGAKTLNKNAQKQINGGNSNRCIGGWCPSTGNCAPCFGEDPIG